MDPAISGNLGGSGVYYISDRRMRSGSSVIRLWGKPRTIFLLQLSRPRWCSCPVMAGGTSFAELHQLPAISTRSSAQAALSISAPPGSWRGARVAAWLFRARRPFIAARLARRETSSAALFVAQLSWPGRSVAGSSSARGSGGGGKHRCKTRVYRRDGGPQFSTLADPTFIGPGMRCHRHDAIQNQAGPRG